MNKTEGFVNYVTWNIDSFLHRYPLGLSCNLLSREEEAGLKATWNSELSMSISDNKVPSHAYLNDQ